MYLRVSERLPLINRLLKSNRRGGNARPGANAEREAFAKSMPTRCAKAERTLCINSFVAGADSWKILLRSEEHTSELQSHA